MVNIDGPESHKQVQDANHGIRANVTASNMRSDNPQPTTPQTSRNTPEQTWYEKVMAAMNQREELRTFGDSTSGSDSTDELSRTEAAIPPKLELGAIYKTTDVHVSTNPNATRKKREYDEDYDKKRVPRQMNLMEMLNAER